MTCVQSRSIMWYAPITNALAERMSIHIATRTVVLGLKPMYQNHVPTSSATMPSARLRVVTSRTCWFGLSFHFLNTEAVIEMNPREIPSTAIIAPASMPKKISHCVVVRPIMLVHPVD